MSRFSFFFFHMIWGFSSSWVASGLGSFILLHHKDKAACLYFPTVKERLLKEVTWQLTFHKSDALYPRFFFSFCGREAIRHSRREWPGRLQSDTGTLQHSPQKKKKKKGEKWREGKAAWKIITLNFNWFFLKIGLFKMALLWNDLTSTSSGGRTTRTGIKSQLGFPGKVHCSGLCPDVHQKAQRAFKPFLCYEVRSGRLVLALNFASTDWGRRGGQVRCAHTD